MSAVNAGNKVFAVPIFFIALREALEASLVIGILLASVESLVKEIGDEDLLLEEQQQQNPEGHAASTASAETQADGLAAPRPKEDNDASEIQLAATPEQAAAVRRSTGAADAAAARAVRLADARARRAALVRRLRKVVLLGAGAGLLVAFCIGAAFLAVFYTQTADLYGRAEELWEGIFNLVAVCLIVPMSLAILRFSSGGVKHKWTRKLRKAFEKHEQRKAFAAGKGQASADSSAASSSNSSVSGEKSSAQQQDDKKSVHSADAGAAAVVPELESGAAPQRRRGLFARLRSVRTRPSWVLFSIPLITTLREGLEGVVFIGGVSLGLPGSSIPLPAIVGLALGFAIGVLVWRGGRFVGHVHYFLLGSTVALLVIAAGMASRSIFYLQFYGYVQQVGDAAAESGSGPGSYNPRQTIAHWDGANPESTGGGSGGWGILNSLFGWENTWTYGSTLSYIAFWLAIAAYLTFAMWKEGRLALAFSFRGREHRIWESRTRRIRRERCEARAAERQAKALAAEKSSEPQALAA